MPRPKSDGTKKIGRPIKPVADTVNSQTEAAARLNVPVEKIKLAKSMGCLAFIAGGRVRLKVLEEFFRTDAFREAEKNRPDIDESTWKSRLEKAKALTAETKLAILRGEYWQAEQMRALITTGDRAMLDTLRRWIENELPPLAQGKSAEQILKIGQGFLDEVIADLRLSRETAMKRLSEATPDDLDPDAEAGNE